MTTPVAVGLGSNLGDRQARLQEAVCGLRGLIEIRLSSAVYESRPMYLEDQPLFLNACCVGDTQLAARSLLHVLQDLEHRAGRRSDGLRFGPRELDMDLLLYGDLVIDETNLRVPHPRMAERPFVLWPLAEIAGDWVHPETGQTMAQMAANLPREGLRPYAPPEELMEAGS